MLITLIVLGMPVPIVIIWLLTYHTHFKDNMNGGGKYVAKIICNNVHDVFSWVHG
jgi:hypothetical protein